MAAAFLLFASACSPARRLAPRPPPAIFVDSWIAGAQLQSRPEEPWRQAIDQGLGVHHRGSLPRAAAPNTPHLHQWGTSAPSSPLPSGQRRQCRQMAA